MQRPHFRPPQPAGGGFRTPLPALDRTGAGRFSSPPYGFPNETYGPRFGSYSGSPATHTSPREFGGNRGGGSRMYNAKSPGQTPHRSSGSPASKHSPHQSPGAHGGYQSPGAHGGYQSPGAHGGYQSPGAHGGYQSPGAHGGYQSPGAHGGYQSPGAHGGYQSPGAHGGYQSPGAHGGYQGSLRTSTPYSRDRSTNDMDKYYKASMLQDPWANLQPVSVTQTSFSFQQATHTGRTGRYYNKNYTA